MIDDIEIAGVGMHPFGRYPDASLKDLTASRHRAALDDAGIGVKDIDAVYSANAMAGLLQGQEQIRGQTVLREVGIERVPIVNVENACASGSTAFRQAVIAIRAGVADIVLAVASRRCSSTTAAGRSRRSRAPPTSTSSAASGCSSPRSTRMRLRKRLDAGRSASTTWPDVR